MNTKFEKVRIDGAEIMKVLAVHKFVLNEEKKEVNSFFELYTLEGEPIAEIDDWRVFPEE